MSQNEKKEITLEQKNSVKKEIETPKIICNSRCKICSSPHLKTIHDLKKTGHTFNQIIEIIFDKFNAKISSASLSRHFHTYQKNKNLISVRIINDDLIEEATKQASHTKELVSLIDQAFSMVRARVDAGTLHLDISDLEKLMKLRYQVMSGENTDENDILAIFQKATNKYGLNMQQGVLFDRKS